MELQEIEPRNLTDKIVESMSEAEAEAGPEPISENETDSIYENPYSTHIYHDFGGSIIIRNFNDDQSTDETIFQKIEQRKWHLLWLVLGLLTGVIVTGLSMHLTIIEELKMNQFKQVFDLESCKRAQSDLAASRQETKEFTKYLRMKILS